MRRRAFIAGLGSAAVWPMVARGQQGAVPVIGYLSPNTLKSSQALANFQGFRMRLRELGLAEGQDFTPYPVTGRTPGTNRTSPQLGLFWELFCRVDPPLRRGMIERQCFVSTLAPQHLSPG
jgi:hypothetical protein